jgi:hypothetical protein
LFQAENARHRIRKLVIREVQKAAITEREKEDARYTVLVRGEKFWSQICAKDKLACFLRDSGNTEASGSGERGRDTTEEEDHLDSDSSSDSNCKL